MPADLIDLCKNPQNPLGPIAVELAQRANTEVGGKYEVFSQKLIHAASEGKFGAIDKIMSNTKMRFGEFGSGSYDLSDLNALLRMAIKRPKPTLVK